MTKKYRNASYLLALLLTGCFLQHLSAQQVSVSYTVRTDYIKHHGGSSSMSCNDAGGGNAEEYSSKRYSYDNVNTSRVSSGCQQCTTTNSTCTVSDEITLAQRTNRATTLHFNWEAWEDDRGDRCSYDGPDNNFLTNDDDCYFNLTEDLQFRAGFGPNGEFTIPDFRWHATPEYGSTNNHSLRFEYQWQYSYQSGDPLLTPGCSEQSADFGTGKIFSWAVQLQAGKRYYFTTCNNGNTNNIVVLYSTQGYGYAIDNWDTGCEPLSRVVYRPNYSGTYYLEVAKFGGNPDARLVRDPVTNAGKVYYGIVGNGAALSISCPADITTNTDSGKCTATVDYDDASTSGGCGDVSLSRISGPASGADFPLGATTVTLQAIDENDQTRQCSFTVQVNDVEAPSALCQNVVVQLDENGVGSTAAAAVDAGSSDACGTPGLSLSQTDFTCDDVGGNTVTLTATDDSGNTNSCTATITVEDNVRPTVVCRNVVVQLDENGLGSTTPEAAVSAGDACGIASVNLQQTDFNCDDLGPNVLLGAATDVNGSESNKCPVIVRVEDRVAPSALCQNVTVQLDDSGNGSLTAADVDAGSSDACGIASTNLSRTAFNCDDLGDNTLTLTVMDNSGNISRCTATLTVEDNQTPPNALCQNVVVQLDEHGLGSTTAAKVDAGSSDACGSVELHLSQTDFSCNDVGDNTVTLTVRGDDGAENTCTATVTAEDNIAPIALCRDATVQLDASGVGSISTGDIDNGSSDFCSGVSLIVSNTDFNCNDIGDNTVTLTVMDNSGNTSSCTATVTVEDKVAPSALCQNVVVQLDENGLGSTAVAEVYAGSSEACGVASANLDRTAFDCNDVGDNIVTLTITDNSGNQNACMATVTVEDNQAPSALCQDFTVELDENGAGSATAADIDAGSDDLCGIASRSLSQTDFDCDDVGNNTVTLILTDNNGNQSTCSATVWVINTPIIVCRSVFIQLDENGFGSTTPEAVVEASDACGIASVTLSQTDFNCDDLGSKRVSGSVKNVNGVYKDCITNVIVEDRVVPSALCQDVVVQLDDSGNGSLTAADVDAGSSDACGIASIYLSRMAFDCNDLGDNMVALTIIDNSGNLSRCMATVTVQDNQGPPSALCQNVVVKLDENGLGSAAAVDVDAGSSDACGSIELLLSQTDFSCDEVGDNTVTLTVRGEDGAESTCTATVTVEDRVGPSIVFLDLTIQLDENGLRSVTPETLFEVSDACGVASVSLDPTDFTCDDLGSNRITGIATDVNGSSSSIKANVIVEDNIAPIALCQDVVVQLNDRGNAFLSVADVDAGSSDACGVASADLSRTAFNCQDVGDNTVTLTITDNSGNQNACTATVTVEDEEAPSAFCQNVTVQLDENGQGSTTAAAVDAGSDDLCGIASRSLSQTDFDCDDLALVDGVPVTLTVTDLSGNQDACKANVFVEAPVAFQINLAPDAKLWPPDYSYQTFTIEDMVVSIGDNCGQTVDLSAARILSVTSDEVEDDPGTQDGNTLNDIVISADCRSVQLRRERMGGGNGRVYTIVIALQGSTAEYKVQVPQWAWGWNSEAVEDATAYQVDGDCAINPDAAVIAPTRPGTTIDLPKGGDSRSSKPDVRVYPNPFDAETNIRLNLPEAGALSVEVFNIQGSRVRRLAAQNRKVGEHLLKWDGRDDGGQALTPGLYLLRVKVGKETLVRKVSLQRM